MKQHCPFLNKHSIYLIDVKLDYAKFFKTLMKEVWKKRLQMHKRGEDEFNLG